MASATYRCARAMYESGKPPLAFGWSAGALDVKIILAVSVVLQYVAAGFALRLVRTSSARLGWLAIFVAIALMAARRSITLFLTVEGAVSPDPAAESVALLISVFMLFGVVTVGPLSNAVAKSERSLREERSRAQSYLDVAGVMMIAIDRDGRITLANRKACETLEVEEDALVGRDWFDTCLPAAVRGEIRTRFDAIIRGDAAPADYYENPVLTRSGDERLIAWHNTLLHDSRGQIAGTLSSGLDVTDRRRRERELEQLHAEVSVIWESLPISTFMCEPRGVMAVTYASPNVLQQCGFRPDDFTSSPSFWADRIHPDDRERVLTRIPERGTHQHEYRWKVADGSYRWFLDFMRFIENDDGTVSHVVGMWQDITERKRTETAIRESEARFRQLAENISEVFWLTNWKPRELLYVSPNYETLFGRTVESLYENRRSWLDVLHPDDRERVSSAFREAAEEGVFVEQEYRIRRPDGTERWVRDRAYPLRDEAGDVYRFVGVAEDVTERKEASRKLREASERTEAILASIGDSIVLIDEEGVVERFNRAAEDLFGYRADEVVGKNVKILMPEPYRSEHDKYIATYIRTGVRKIIGAHREVVGRRKDGSTFSLDLHVSEVDLDDRRAFSGTITDITFRNEAADQEAKHQAELAHVARLSTMGEMAAGLAHEINQPLTAIVNYTTGSLRQLRAGVPASKEVIEALDRASSQARRAGEIIRRLNDFVRKREPRQEHVDLGETIEDVIRFLGSELRRGSVTIDRHLAVDLPPVRGDSIQLQQVMLNLIKNGIEAMVAVPATERRMVVSAVKTNGSEIRVTVGDRGHGLVGQTYQNIFDQFYTTKPDGMGMGLSISRSIIELHGGRLTAANNQFGGATFSFALPIDEGERTP